MISRRTLLQTLTLSPLVVESALALPKVFPHGLGQSGQGAVNTLGAFIVDNQLINAQQLQDFLQEVDSLNAMNFSRWLEARVVQERQADHTRWVNDWLLSESEIHYFAILYLVGHGQ